MAEVWLVVLATQLPDLIDKPLAWSLSILPAGRSLGHSLFAFVFVSSIAIVVARRYERQALGVAVSVAYSSHLLSDAITPLRTGQVHELGYFLWPITAGSGSADRSIVAFLEAASIDGLYGYHGLALATFVLIWLLDGAPGVWPERWKTETGD